MRESRGSTDNVQVVSIQVDERLRMRLDSDHFRTLYDATFDAVYRYCYHRLGDWNDAEDATSLVFANAFASLPNYRGELDDAALRSWLFSIAHNVVANSVRYRRRHPVQPLENAQERADLSATPEEAALANESHRIVHELLAQLPIDQRRLVELRLAGLKDAEIANIVGKSHGSVRVAQHRAVLRLRELLWLTPRGSETDRG